MTAPALKKTPPLPPSFDPRRMILWSVILVVFVGTLGYAAYMAGPSSYGGFDVALTVTAEPVHIPMTGETAGQVKLTATLQNKTAKAKTVHAPAPCKFFRWLLIDDQGAIVQAKVEETCDPLLTELALEPGNAKTHEEQLTLDTTRLKAGALYRFVVEFWGQRGLLVVRTSS